MKFKSILLAVCLLAAFIFSMGNYVICPYKAGYPLRYDDANGTFYLPDWPNVYTKTVEISIAEIKTLYSAPKTLLAAPGAHKFYKFLGATLIYDSNSAGYETVGHNITINYTSGSGGAVSGTLSGTGFLDQTTTDKIAQVIPAAVASTTGSSVDNAILCLSKATADPCGAGDGTMRAILLYQILESGL